MDGKSIGVISTPGLLCWKVYVDGTANQRGFGVGLVLISPEETIIEKSLRLRFSATNNEVEYEALLQGIAMIQKMGGKAVEMFSDSRLVVGQVKGELEAIDARMQEYLSHSNAYSRALTFLACRTSLRVETPMQIHWPRLPPPRQWICPELFSSSIWTERMK